MTDAQLTIVLTSVPSIIGALVAGYVLIRLNAVKAETDKVVKSTAQVAATVETVAAIVETVVTKVDTVAAATEQQTPKIEDALSGIKVVEKMVDGAASKASAEADSLRKEIRMLLVARAEDKEKAALLAQAVSAVERTTAETAAGVNHLNGMDEPSHSVEQIEKHTAETARNTARTEQGVQELKDKP